MRCINIPLSLLTIIQKVGRRKLRMLNNSQNLPDLRIPSPNILERLKGKAKD